MLVPQDPSGRRQQLEQERRQLIQLSGRYRVAKWLSLFARVDNLLDYEYVVTATGAPGLPRGFYFGGLFEF